MSERELLERAKPLIELACWDGTVGTAEEIMQWIEDYEAFLRSRPAPVEACEHKGCGDEWCEECGAYREWDYHNEKWFKWQLPRAVRVEVREVGE